MHNTPDQIKCPGRLKTGTNILQGRGGMVIDINPRVGLQYVLKVKSQA